MLAASGSDALTRTHNATRDLATETSATNGPTVAYQYDASGNRVEVKLDGCVFTTYAYDDASRLQTITRGSSTFGFDYDNANRRTSMGYPNGIATGYEYDTLNRLTLIAGRTPSVSKREIKTFTFGRGRSFGLPKAVREVEAGLPGAGPGPEHRHAVPDPRRSRGDEGLADEIRSNAAERGLALFSHPLGRQNQIVVEFEGCAHVSTSRMKRFDVKPGNKATLAGRW